MELVARLREYLRGYVVVRVSGPAIERFVNLGAGAGVAFQALKRLGDGVAVVQVPARDFFRLRSAARQAGVRVRLVQRAGLPFVASRLVRRPGLLAGAAAAAALLWVLGSRIWEVRVEGPDEVDRRAVIETLARLGLRPGVARGSVRPQLLERELLLGRPELAWADVRLRGTVAVVEVRLRRDAGPGLGQTGDVVASHDGLVTELSVLSGWPAVRPGDVVRRGQVLISGRTGSSTLRAAGWVKARVWAEGYGESRPQLVLLEPAGRVARGVAVRVGPWRWHLGAVTPPFQRFRRLGTGRWRLPGPGTGLPLAVEWVAYEQLRTVQLAIGLEAARRLAEEAAFQQAVERLGPRPDILEVRRWVWEEDLGEQGVVVRSRVQVEALQEIGRFQPHPPPAQGDNRGHPPLVSRSRQVYTGVDVAR